MTSVAPRSVGQALRRLEGESWLVSSRMLQSSVSSSLVFSASLRSQFLKYPVFGSLVVCKQLFSEDEVNTLTVAAGFSGPGSLPTFHALQPLQPLIRRATEAVWDLDDLVSRRLPAPAHQAHQHTKD